MNTQYQETSGLVRNIWFLETRKLETPDIESISLGDGSMRIPTRYHIPVAGKGFQGVGSQTDLKHRRAALGPGGRHILAAQAARPCTYVTRECYLCVHFRCASGVYIIVEREFVIPFNPLHAVDDSLR